MLCGGERSRHTGRSALPCSFHSNQIFPRIFLPLPPLIIPPFPSQLWIIKQNTKNNGCWSFPMNHEVKHKKLHISCPQLSKREPSLTRRSRRSLTRRVCSSCARSSTTWRRSWRGRPSRTTTCPRGSRGCSRAWSACAGKWWQVGQKIQLWI